MALGGIGQGFGEQQPVIEQVVQEDIVSKWAKSDRTVRKQYEQFVGLVREAVALGALSEEDGVRILQGAAFAAEKHQSQERRNGKKTPYLTHLIGVADHVMRVGKVFDADIVIGALLHDTLNEGVASKEEIAKTFGKKVAGYVLEMTEDSSLSSLERKKMQIIHAPKQSFGATIIKLSDKWQNLNTLMKDPSDGWTKESMDLYFQWAQAVIENLPEVNDSLKESAGQTIAAYWESQK
jgi:guanosine-3',5'-bis(diphosphate) 3'-pyrophosphohydrolase